MCLGIRCHQQMVMRDLLSVQQANAPREYKKTPVSPPAFLFSYRDWEVTIRDLVGVRDGLEAHATHTAHAAHVATRHCRRCCGCILWQVGNHGFGCDQQ